MADLAGMASSVPPTPELGVFLVQDPERPMHVVAESLQAATTRWETELQSRLLHLGESMRFVPKSVQVVCRPGDLLFARAVSVDRRTLVGWRLSVLEALQQLVTACAAPLETDPARRQQAWAAVYEQVNRVTAVRAGGAT